MREETKDRWKMLAKELLVSTLKAKLRKVDQMDFFDMTEDALKCLSEDDE